MKKKKLKKKLRAAVLETDLFAGLILKITEQAETQLVRQELRSVQAVCERAQQERDLAMRDMHDAEVTSIGLEDKLNEIRDAVWGDVDSTQALYMVRRLVPDARGQE